MHPVSLDQGWHTQFLTKFQKLDGFGLLAPGRIGARWGAYAWPEREAALSAECGPGGGAGNRT